jgi:hypothetical protein
MDEKIIKKQVWQWEYQQNLTSRSYLTLIVSVIISIKQFFTSFKWLIINWIRNALAKYVLI